MKRLAVALGLLVVLISTSVAQTAKRVEDVVYMKQGGAAFTLDVFQPEKPNGRTVVYLVSGGWVSDHNNINAALAAGMNGRGFTVVQVVHGAQPRYKVPEIVGQVTRAIRFLHANGARYGIDPKRLGLMGGSAGGHLSLLLAAKAATGNPNAADPVERMPATVSAVGVFFPPTDFENWRTAGSLALEDPILRAGFGNAFVPDIRTAPKDRLIELSRELSPMRFFTAKMPPTILVHGDKDALVPIQQSQIAEARLKELGVPVRLITVRDKGHGWPEMATEMMEILDWFNRYLP